MARGLATTFAIGALLAAVAPQAVFAAPWSTSAYDVAQDYAEGLAALRQEDYKGAAKVLAHVTHTAPNDPNLWRLLGQADLGDGDLKGARKAYGQAVKLEPDNFESHRGLGLAYAALKDPKAQDELQWLRTRAQTCGTCAEAAGLKAASGALATAIASR